MTRADAPSKQVATRRRPPEPKRKWDWEAVRATYVEGFEDPSNKEERKWVTMEEVAQHWKMNPGLLRRKAAEERWVEQRASYQARVAHSRRQRRILALGKEAVEFDGRALSAAKLGMTMVQARLGEIARDMQAQSLRRQDAERRAAAGLVVDPEDFATVIDARELNVLGQAAQQFQSLAKHALGEDVIRHEHTGADGGAIEVEQDVKLSMRDELERDDPDRAVALLDVLERAGLLQAQDEPVDGEVVEDGDEQP